MPIAHTLREDEITKKLKETHWRAMSKVFEELGPLLKEIRTRLNDLTLLKSDPKVRALSCCKKGQPQAALVSFLQTEDTGKAGKVCYSILVGETSIYTRHTSLLQYLPEVLICMGIRKRWL